MNCVQSLLIMRFKVGKAGIKTHWWLMLPFALQGQLPGAGVRTSLLLPVVREKWKAADPTAPPRTFQFPASVCYFVHGMNCWQKRQQSEQSNSYKGEVSARPRPLRFTDKKSSQHLPENWLLKSGWIFLVTILIYGNSCKRSFLAKSTPYGQKWSLSAIFLLRL